MSCDVVLVKGSVALIERRVFFLHRADEAYIKMTGNFAFEADPSPNCVPLTAKQTADTQLCDSLLEIINAHPTWMWQHNPSRYLKATKQSGMHVFNLIKVQVQLG